MKITGAQLFVKALKEEQVDTLFAYPGGQVIDLFDALYGEKDINVILPRHEQGLVHAADGYARSTGKTGVCLVTSGPGAANLVTGIATADYDSIPLVCFAGQVPTGLRGSRAFQEVDIVSITKSICKYAVSVQRRGELAAVIKKAFAAARTGRPGVVVVELPKDIQRAYGSDAYPRNERADENDAYPRNERADGGSGAGMLSVAGHKGIGHMIPAEEKMLEEAMGLLKKAERPVFLVGGGVNISGAGPEMQKLAEITGIPVVSTIMGRGAVSTTHRLYVGNIGIHGRYAANAAVSQCDVLFAIGTRFSDRITGDAKKFASHAAVIHIDIQPASLSENIAPVLSIGTDAGKAIQSLLEKAQPLAVRKWQLQIQEWKKQYPLRVSTRGLNPQKIIQEINRMYDNAIIAVDVGQNQLWASQFLELNEKKKMITSGGMGTMGYGFPAALGAKIGSPDRDVIVISGDGGMQMNIQEMAAAVAYELPVTICILNNGSLGNVKQWQEMFFHKRYVSTCIRFSKSCLDHCDPQARRCPRYIPDFVLLAQSYGARGIRVTREADIPAALRAAKEETKVPFVIEFIIDPEAKVLPIVPPGHALDDMILEDIS